MRGHRQDWGRRLLVPAHVRPHDGGLGTRPRERLVQALGIGVSNLLDGSRRWQLLCRLLRCLLRHWRGRRLDRRRR